MIKSNEARAVGRQMLRDKGKLIIGASALQFALGVAMSLVSLALNNQPGLSFLWSVGIIFLTVPLTLGMLHILNMIYYKRQCSIGNLFDFFRNYGVSIKVVGTSFIFAAILMVILMPLAIIMIMPFVMLTISAGPLAIADNMMFAMLPGLLLFALVSVFISMLVSSVILAPYFIALRNRSVTFGRLLSLSFQIGWKYLWKYFVLQLTFLGWTLLTCVPCVICMVIGFFIGDLFPFGAGFIVVIIFVLVGVLLTFAAAVVLSAYINAATVAFFNVGIDEFENGSSGTAPAVGPVPFRVQEPQEPTPPEAFPRQEEPPADPEPEQPSEWVPKEPQPEEQTPAEEPEKPSFVPEPSPEPQPQQEEEVPSVEPSVIPEPSPELESEAVPEPETPKTIPGIEHVEAETVETSPAQAEKIIFDVVLVASGISRLMVAQTLSDILGIGFGEATAVLDELPKTICSAVPKEEAREIAKLLTEAGAKVELR